MENLSSRIKYIIDTLAFKISSMEESAEDCAAHTVFAGELYALFNKVKRMEQDSPDNYAFFEETGVFVLRIEKELHKLSTKPE
jgi:hypothetical protein